MSNTESSSDETVWIVSNATSGRPLCYHTDPECPFLANGTRVFEKRRSLVASHKDHCRQCQGYDRHSGNTMAFRDKVAAMDPEDLGLSPSRGETDD